MSSRPRGALHRSLPLLAALLALVLLVPVNLSAQDGAGAGTAVTTTALNLRSGPSTSNAVLTVMPAGATVSVTGGAQSGFLPVTYNGTSGWASSSFLTLGSTSPATGGTATTTTAVNLRSGAGTTYGIITVLPSGATVALTGQSSNGFASVTYNGLQGWVSQTYLSTSGAPAPAPQPAPAPATGTARTTSALNLRTGPSTSNSSLTVMPAGATVSLTGQSSNGFLSVTYNGMSGWAYADFLSTGTAAPSQPAPAPAPAVGTAQVTTSLHLRSGPSTSNSSLTVMPAGATVSVTGTAQSGFLPVTYNGISGWAYAQFLNTGGAPTTPSQPAPAPQPTGSMVTTANLNMRSSASLSASILTVIPAGTTVAVTGAAQNGFLPVQHGGFNGWASASFLSQPGTAAPAPTPGGGSGLRWPVSGGTWSIIQGYNGGTHQNRSSTAQYYYSLDIARTDGNTAGQSVYAPASGTILWLDPGSGGIAINMGNGYVVAMFHATFDGGLVRGQSVSQGQYLGTISGPGGAGYASTPHIDITLWRSSDGGRTRSAAPFTGGNAISGMDFPDVGGWNQHAGTQFNP